MIDYKKWLGYKGRSPHPLPTSVITTQPSTSAEGVDHGAFPDSHHLAWQEHLTQVHLAHWLHSDQAGALPRESELRDIDSSARVGAGRRCRQCPTQSPATLISTHPWQLLSTI